MQKTGTLSEEEIMISGKYRYIAFLELLGDAILQLREAKRTSEVFLINRFARASILTSALSVECVANCLLVDLDTSRKLSDELDRMSPLSKIEVYLQLKSKPPLDRGNRRVGKIAELITARNDFVHPKVKGIPASIKMPEDGGKEWLIPFKIEGTHHSQLEIPEVPMFWCADDALTVLRAIGDFFQYLFCTLLQSNKEEMSRMLVSRIEAGEIQIPAVYDHIITTLQSAKEIGVDFSYLGLFDTAKTTNQKHTK